MAKFSNISKIDRKDLFLRIFKIILGTTILAFGQVVFIEQCVLVTGGLTSIGNIINHFLPSEYTVPICVVSLNIILFILGYVFIGKKFSAQTLLSTIVYTLVYPLFSMLISKDVINFLRISTVDNTSFLLASVFGGVFTGLGIAICMIGGGSTGGVDIISILLAKLTKSKVALWVFIIDAAVVVIGCLILKMDLIRFLICALSTLCCSVTIEFVFTRQNNCYVVNIISKQWKTINEYIIKELDRGSTIFNVEGGYKFENYRMIQVVIPRNQYSRLLTYISEVDEFAFVTANSAHEVNGEGFNNLTDKKEKK